MLLRILRRRGCAGGADAEARVLATTDPARIERWQREWRRRQRCATRRRLADGRRGISRLGGCNPAQTGHQRYQQCMVTECHYGAPAFTHCPSRVRSASVMPVRLLPSGMSVVATASR